MTMNELKAFDARFSRNGCRYLIGVDEAGRGPLAGPVVAAAVLLKANHLSVPVQDSKKMTARQRWDAYFEIQDNAYVGIGVMNERIIDAVNILEAAFLAMNAAVRQLCLCLRKEGLDPDDTPRKTRLLIDGNQFKTDLPYAYETIIGGDGKSFSIACASVIAKVTRDRILECYHQIFPQYGFDRHKGYPTAMHRKALKEFGPVLIHRRTFNAVRQVCEHPPKDTRLV